MNYYEEYLEWAVGENLDIPEARLAVYMILRDLESRRGLRQEFESLDRDIKHEIIKDWAMEIRKATGAAIS